MRLLYVTAIAIAGTALIASPMMRPRAQTADVALPANTEHALGGQANGAVTTAEAASNGVQIVDELISAVTVKAPPPTRSGQRPTPPRAISSHRRSLLARVFLGSGDHRPRPFPRPGS